MENSEKQTVYAVWLSVEEFDIVTVSRSFHRCEPTNEEQEVSAWITFKTSVCDSITRARMELQQGGKAQ